MRSHSTLRASRSLSKLCPMRMVSALNILSSTAWTSRRLMVVFSKSSCVTPENLWRIHTAFMILYLFRAALGELTSRHNPPSVKSHKANSPRVVIYHFAFRFDERIVDDFHLRVDDRHPRQFQALLCVTLIRTTTKKDLSHDVTIRCILFILKGESPCPLTGRVQGPCCP